MNNFLKRAACLAVTAVMTLSSTGALACTGYYVGKQASASGHTIIGHTVDAWNTAQAKQVVYPHSEEPGRCRMSPISTPPRRSSRGCGITLSPTRWA